MEYYFNLDYDKICILSFLSWNINKAIIHLLNEDISEEDLKYLNILDKYSYLVKEYYNEKK